MTDRVGPAIGLGEEERREKGAVERVRVAARQELELVGLRNC